MTHPRPYDGRRVRWRDDRGVAATVEVLLLLPLTTGLLLMGVQTVLWQHARTLAADRANQTAALVATGELGVTAATDQLTARLEASPDLTRVAVTVTRTAQLVTVHVSAQAHGILVGTRTRVTVDAATPTEGWQPLP